MSDEIRFFRDYLFTKIPGIAFGGETPREGYENFSIIKNAPDSSNLSRLADEFFVSSSLRQGDRRVDCSNISLEYLGENSAVNLTVSYPGVSEEPVLVTVERL